MGLWIAIFITLAVFGSILWVKPSPREMMLTKYRNGALARGIKVRLLDAKLAEKLFPWIDNYRSFVFYEKSLPVSSKPTSHKAIIVRISDNLHAHEIDEEDSLKQAISLNVGFDGLPDTVEALIISASGISLLWREKLEGDSSIEKTLGDIEGFLDRCIQNSKIWT